MQLQKFKIWIFPLCLGTLVAWASLTLRFGTRADTLHNLSATLGGQDFHFKGFFVGPVTPFYNRIMFPLIHQGLFHLFPTISEERWYLMLRIVSFQLAFVVRLCTGAQAELSRLLPCRDAAGFVIHH